MLFLVPGIFVTLPMILNIARMDENLLNDQIPVIIINFTFHSPPINFLISARFYKFNFTTVVTIKDKFESYRWGWNWKRLVHIYF